MPIRGHFLLDSEIPNKVTHLTTIVDFVPRHRSTKHSFSYSRHNPHKLCRDLVKSVLPLFIVWTAIKQGRRNRLISSPKNKVSLDILCGNRKSIVRCSRDQIHNRSGRERNPPIRHYQGHNQTSRKAFRLRCGLDGRICGSSD